MHYDLKGVGCGAGQYNILTNPYIEARKALYLNLSSNTGVYQAHTNNTTVAAHIMHHLTGCNENNKAEDKQLFLNNYFCAPSGFNKKMFSALESLAIAHVLASKYNCSVIDATNFRTSYYSSSLVHPCNNVHLKQGTGTIKFYRGILNPVNDDLKESAHLLFQSVLATSVQGLYKTCTLYDDNIKQFPYTQVAAPTNLNCLINTGSGYIGKVEVDKLKEMPSFHEAKYSVIGALGDSKSFYLNIAEKETKTKVDPIIYRQLIENNNNCQLLQKEPPKDSIVIDTLHLHKDISLYEIQNEEHLTCMNQKFIAVNSKFPPDIEAVRELVEDGFHHSFWKGPLVLPLFLPEYNRCEDKASTLYFSVPVFQTQCYLASLFMAAEWLKDGKNACVVTDVENAQLSEHCVTDLNVLLGGPCPHTLYGNIKIIPGIVVSLSIGQGSPYLPKDSVIGGEVIYKNFCMINNNSNFTTLESNTHTFCDPTLLSNDFANYISNLFSISQELYNHTKMSQDFLLKAKEVEVVEEELINDLQNVSIMSIAFVTAGVMLFDL